MLSRLRVPFVAFVVSLTSIYEVSYAQPLPDRTLVELTAPRTDAPHETRRLRRRRRAVIDRAMVHGAASPYLSSKRTQTAQPQPRGTSHPSMNRALWVWSMADRIVMKNQDRLDFFSFLATPHGNPNAAINVVFMSITKDVIDHHPASVRDFLLDAHSRGVQVDFLIGDPLWALTLEDPATMKPFNQPSIDLLDKILAFQADTDNPLERFDGFQQDTEPYLFAPQTGPPLVLG